MDASDRLVIGTLEDTRCEGIADASLSHIDLGSWLERVSYTESLNLLRHLASKLRDRGRMRIAVSDFDWICEAYRKGDCDIEPVLCGDRGMNRSVWNRQKICDVVNMAGMEIVGGSNALGWKPVEQTIDIMAEKRLRKQPDVPIQGVTALMSLPRIAWTETFSNTLEVCARLQMPFVKSTGVFWGQSLERMLTGQHEKGTKYALTIDYDSIFDVQDVIRLWQIMEDNPDVTALCPLQIGRERDALLINLIDKNGNPMKDVTTEYFYNEVVDIKNGHFGLTMIRLEHLNDIPHPWFLGVPNKDGRWEENRTDDDIYFWHKLRAAGRRVCATPKVRLGHLQLVISWPTDDCSVKHQYVNNYHAEGRPPECMTY